MPEVQMVMDAARQDAGTVSPLQNVLVAERKEARMTRHIPLSIGDDSQVKMEKSMTQDEAYHCLLRTIEFFVNKTDVNAYLKVVYKTDIDYVLKSASPETVYGALHEWAKEKE